MFVRRGKRMEYFCGIDLGGTHIAAGIVNQEYKIVGRCALPVQGKGDPMKIAHLMTTAVCSAARECHVDMGSAEKQRKSVCATISGWTGFR